MLDTGEIGSCDNLRDFLLRADDGAMKEMVTDRLLQGEACGGTKSDTQLQ